MKLQSTHVVAVTNQKGGCGKTTTCLSLGAALARQGYKVCIVDNDEQCNASQGLGFDIEAKGNADQFTIADAYLKKTPLAQCLVSFDGAKDQEGEPYDRSGLYLVPATRGLSAIEKHLEAEFATEVARGDLSPLEEDEVKDEQRHRLRNAIASLRREKFDFVFIDCPPSLGFLMTSALIAADWFIIPLFPSGFELKGVDRLRSTIGRARERYNPNLTLLTVLLLNVNMRAKLDQHIHANLVDTFGEEHACPATVANSVRHKEATVFGRTIFEHAPSDPASDSFLEVAEHVVKRVSLAEAAAHAAAARQTPADAAAHAPMEVNRG